jgi:predicted DNA-binding transcriptional regulator AlpA
MQRRHGVSKWGFPVSFLEKLKVIRDVEMPELLGVSSRTWERMRACGDHPPKVQISERRIGYVTADVEEWLNAKRRIAGDWQQIGDAAQRVAEQCGADIRDHNIKMQRELNRQKGD